MLSVTTGFMPSYIYIYIYILTYLSTDRVGLLFIVLSLVFA